jgi:CIC family chloride channel protein
LVLVCLTAVVAGAVTGFIGGAFRWCLQRADVWRIALVEWTHGLPGPGWLLPMTTAAFGAACAAWIVRRVPLAAGSGIQHVEAVYRGDAKPPLLVLLPAKFIGGLLSIGSGLVLGREGPTVHMGAAIGAETAKRARLSEPDIRMMQTVVGGAGLAVAFNAPIGGTLFALEEVSKSFRKQTVLAAFFAAAAAVGCMRIILGNQPDFLMARIGAPALAWLPLFGLFGLLTGWLGAAYNRTVLWFLDNVGGLQRIPAIAKAAIIGAIIGLAMFVYPHGVGGGETLTQLILSGHQLALPVIVGYLLVRFVAGPLSYSAAVPGGLFAPLLAVGALWGLLFVGISDALLPLDATALAMPMALVGMAAFFGATVRAPLTAVVVIIEMTATASAAVPMLVATAAAVFTAELTGTPPIYDSLRERMAPEPGLRQ